MAWLFSERLRPWLPAFSVLSLVFALIQTYVRQRLRVFVIWEPGLETDRGTPSHALTPGAAWGSPAKLLLAPVFQYRADLAQALR